MCNTRSSLVTAMLTLGLIAGQGRAAEDPNLIGWWTFDDGSGIVAKDASGKGHEATLLGGPDWVPGALSSGALSFDGADDMIEVPEVPAFDLGNALTITAWLKLNNLSTYYFILDKQPSGTAPSNYPGHYEFRTTTGTGVLQLLHQTSQSTDYATYNATAGVAANRWTHVAVTFVKGGQVKFYLDGAPAGSVPQTANFPVLNDEPIRIAGRKDGYSFFNGQLDDVRLYNRALTDAEIKQVGAWPKAHDPKPADGALAVTMPLLQWTPATFALFHNVYLGTAVPLTEADLVGSRQLMAMLYYVQGLKPGTLYYWRVDEIDAAGAVQAGDVWSFVAQDLKAYHPTPADGTTDASQAPVLTWLPGQTVAKHHLYFGDSSEAVTQGAAGTDKGELADPNFTPGALESLTTYYWRVDELVAGGTVRTGPVWKFTTCLSVDDFESYTDDLEAKTTIFDTWIDGLTNGLSGSVVGNATAPFAERTIVHGGKQSMPMDYNNVKSPYYSEAEREFAPAQDWTTNGADTLILYVRGRAGNAAAPLYVALEDSSKHLAVVTHPDVTITAATKWTQWKIPLSDFAGVNPARVKKMYIGVGDRKAPAAGGAGRIYLDDIQVTRP
jgi:hypothetical protein